MSAPAVIATTDDAGLRDYPGAKNAPGVWQTIINNIPPHEVFVEAFAGSASVTRRKRPSASSIVIERDAAVFDSLVLALRPAGSSLIEQFAFADLGQNECQLGSVRLVRGCAVGWLERNGGTLGRNAVVYCDPPYLASTRSDPSRRYYRTEFNRLADHAELLEALKNLAGARVLISGRRSKLYDMMLEDWRRVDYQTSTRAGAVTECLWCNFAEPEALHDWRYLGRNFRERERIKRKVARWRTRLAAMPILERRLVAAALARDGEG